MKCTRKKIAGKFLKAFREKHNFSKQEFADILEVCPATLDRYEKGKSSISIKYLYILHAKLGVSSDEILGPFSQEVVINTRRLLAQKKKLDNQ